MQEISYSHRVKLIDSFDCKIRQLIECDWQPYLVNFSFRQMPRKPSTKVQIMTDEVYRVYSILLTHVVRKPNSPVWKAWKPKFIGCPDLPVAKNKKIDAYVSVPNDGWHYHGCLLLPPEDQCRLKQHLHDHFQQNRALYIRPRCHLDRIHAITMASPVIADYLFKHIKRGNIAYDDILILPRHQSELPDK